MPTKTKRLSLLALLALTTACTGVRADDAPPNGPGAAPMNVLMIIVDDLNTLGGSYGGPAITPNMDAFAQTAVRFEDAYPASPSCNPSRTAMLTGLRPESSGVFSNGQEFRKVPSAKDLETLPQMLRRHGFNTLSSGKIFHNARGGKAQPAPLSDPQSWTYQADIDGGKFFGHDFDNEFLDGNGVPKWVSRATGVPTDAKAKRLVKRMWSYGPMQDVDPKNTLDFNSGRFASDYVNDVRAAPLVAAAPPRDEKPFFLATGIFRPHIPLIVSQRYFDLYERPENIHRLEPWGVLEGDRDDLPKGAGAATNWYVDYIKGNADESRHLRHAYLAASTYADEAVGIALDGLEKSGLADRTIVLVLGDHGYDLGQKDHVGKAMVWRHPSRTPLMIRVPGLEPGVCDEPVSLLDLYPTLLDLLGIDERPTLDGESLRPLLENPGAERATPAVVTSAGRGTSISVVKDHWNYISHVGGDEELYDHRNDPHEYDNLLAASTPGDEASEVVGRLAKFVPDNRAETDGAAAAGGLISPPDKKR